MYNRTNTYIHNGKRVSFDWFQFTHKGKKSVVIKEAHTEGPSLTNSIEAAIARLLYIMKEPLDVFQDCQDEGVFKIEYDYGVEGNIINLQEIEVRSVTWHYFSKDLTSLELLYAQA